MISYLDEKIGSLVNNLRELDLAENTIVILTSDHGEMMGEHGMWFKGTFLDWSSRVPFIVSFPARWSGGRRVREVISLVDLFPTLLDIARLDDFEEMEAESDGDSFRKILDGKGTEWKNYAISEYYGEGVIHAARMLRKGRYKYIYVHEEAPRLFDIEADPNEQVNLAGVPEFRQVEEEMRKILLDRWGVEAMEERVLRSQRERLLIKQAIPDDESNIWDFQPFFNARNQYVRLRDAQETNELMRYPRVKIG